MDRRELIFVQNVEMSRNAMSNSPRCVAAKLTGVRFVPNDWEYERSIPLFVSRVILYTHKLSLRIAESSALEFGLVRKILSVLVVVVQLPGAHPSHWRRLPLSPRVISCPVAWVLSVPGFVTLSSGEFSDRPTRSNVQLPSPVSERTKERILYLS